MPLYGLYELMVSHPTPKTWYLAGVDLDADQLYAGAPAYQGVVEADGPIEAAGVLGGISEGGRVSLTLRNGLASYRGQGRYRRFADQFAENAPGASEPYDLDTASLIIKVTWDGLTVDDVLTLGRWVIVAGSKRLEAGQLRLDFESDPRFHRPLPQRKITAALYPNAPDTVIGRSIPLVFGFNVLLPGLLVDPAIGRYLFCESPRETPVNFPVLSVVAPNPVSQVPELVILTDPGGVLEDIDAGGAGTNVNIASPSQPYHEFATSVLYGQDYLITSLEIKLRRSSSGASTVGGRLVATLETDDGTYVPSGQTVAPQAQGGIDATDVTADTTFRFYVFAFASPVLLRAGTRAWVRIRWVPDSTVTTTVSIQIERSTNAVRASGVGSRILTRDNASANDGVWRTDGLDFAHGAHDLRVNAGSFTLSVDHDDGSGNRVAVATFNQDMADIQLVGSFDGCEDDASGTYTGTPASRIAGTPDVLRFLMLAPIAMALPAGLVNTGTLGAARPANLHWFLLRGVVAEDADAMLWLQRVARSGRGVVYEDQDGRLSFMMDGPGPSPTPVRAVKYWEHGALTLEGQPEAGGQPWTLVEVYAARNLISITPPEFPEVQRVAEWQVLLRHQASDDLIARYGIRTNGGIVEGLPGRFLGGPTESNAYHFVGTAADAQELLDWLIGTGAKRLDPWGVARVNLERFALGWRLMDEVTLESQEFPSALGRALVGEVTWAGATWDSGATQWYQCRRGRFSVRALGIITASGPTRPVQAVLKLVGWETP